MAAPHIRAPRAVLRQLRLSVPVTAPSRRWASTSLSQEIWATDRGIDIKEVAEKRGIKLPQTKEPLSAEDQAAIATVRTPHNLAAIRLRPLRRVAQHGIPVCDLQLRTYSLANMDLFADFAMRAAYYLGLPAKGPIPLPRITERWTVPRSNFIFKKSQENFERITMRRLIQIQDGHPETVRIWLGVLQKYQYHGVGMKANVWEWESLDAVSQRDAQLAKAKPDMDKVWKGFGTRKESVLGQKVQEILARPEYGGALEVARQEDEKQRARMDAEDEAARLQEQEMEEEEFDKSFVKMFGPDALQQARNSKRRGKALSAEEKKKEVERFNRVMSELDTMTDAQMLQLREKWRALEVEAEEDEEDGIPIRDVERMMEALGLAEGREELPESFAEDASNEKPQATAAKADSATKAKKQEPQDKPGKAK